MKNTHKTVGKEDSKGVFKQAVLCNWQLFQTPSGYSMANSIIESYNHRIKAYFTCGLKFHMLPVVRIFADAIQQVSQRWTQKEARLPNGWRAGQKNLLMRSVLCGIKRGVIAIPEVKLPKKKCSMPITKIVHVVSFLTKLFATIL